MIKSPPVILAIFVFLLIAPAVMAEAPEIVNVTQSSKVMTWGENITIWANITDADGDIDKVIVNFTSPFSELLETTNKTGPYETGGDYELNYTPGFPLIYKYRIFANDSTGNFTLSGEYNFSVQIEDYAIISVEVAPTCGVGFSFYFVPQEVFREQTVFFLQINENIGNMDVNETSEMYLNYYNGSLEWGPLFDETVLLEPWDEDLHYGLWNTKNDTPFGKYYWHGITHFIGRVQSGEVSYYPWPDYNATANCTEPEDMDSDGINETECWYHFRRTASNAYAKIYNSSTTQASSVTLPNQNTSVPTYYGLVNVSEDNTNITGFFNAYTFKMNDCTEYCYACFSNDTAISDDECAYSAKWYNGMINNELGNFTVTEMSPDGTNVTFAETFVSYTDRYIVSLCEVNYSTGILECNDSVHCNGSLEIIDDLEVILSKGGEEEQPSPETEPEPSPTPSPKPTPEPAPGQIEINIYPVDPEVSGMQEQLTPVEFVVENLGGRTVTDITLVPIVGSEWLYENTTVDSIAPGEKLNRTLFIQPTYLVEPAVYAIPVQALDANGDVLDMTYFWFEVLPGKFLAKIMIVESPAEITLDSDSLEEIPILVKNVGKKPLTGVRAKLENTENCIINITSPEMELEVDEETPLNLKVTTRTGPKTCNAMLIVESREDAYAFARMKINVAPPSAFLPGGLPLIPLLAVIFLILLVVLIVLRRRGRYVGILYPIVSVATLILLVYIFLWYLGFVPIF